MDKQVYQNALARAHAVNATVVQEAANVYTVAAPGHPSHTVQLAQDGKALVCNCAAYQFNSYCYHRAIVHATLVKQVAVKNFFDQPIIAFDQPIVEPMPHAPAIRISDKNFRDEYARAYV